MTYCLWYSALFVIVNSQSHQFLTESEIYFDQMVYKEYRHFYSFINIGNSLDIAVQPIYGDTNLFVNVSNDEIDPSNSLMPSELSYEYSSMQAITLETIHIPQTRFVSCTTNCILKISILCLSSGCGFNVFYDQDKPLILLPNRPTQGSTIKNTFTYFRYLREDNLPLLILLTVLGTSNPDVYVSKEKIPTQQNAT